MDKQREMFEVWADANVGKEYDVDGKPNYTAISMRSVMWETWQAAIAAQQGDIITMPEPGTTEYGSWINKAKDKADQCFASHGEDRFKWLCQFEQHLRKSANGGEK